jgi:hypothetical protein
MNWNIRRTEMRGETVALDIEENGELVAGVTIRGDIAKAEKRAALIHAAPELLSCVTVFVNQWGKRVDNGEDMNGGDVVDWIGDVMSEFQRAVAKAKGQS